MVTELCRKYIQYFIYTAKEDQEFIRYVINKLILKWFQRLEICLVYLDAKIIKHLQPKDLLDDQIVICLTEQLYKYSESLILRYNIPFNKKWYFNQLNEDESEWSVKCRFRLINGLPYLLNLIHHTMKDFFNN